MNGKLYIEFLQNPLDGHNIQYVINENGAPLEYPFNNAQIVDKTFGDSLTGLTALNRIARGNSDHDVDSWGTGLSLFDEMVNDVRINASGTSAYATGRFKSFNGQNRYGLAKFNPSTGAIQSFSSDIYGTGTYEGNTIAITQSNIGTDIILVGGRFNNPSSQPTNYNNIIRFGATGSIDSSFNQGTGFRRDGDVTKAWVNKILIQPDGKILVGGYFNFYNGNYTANIVRLNDNGTFDSTFNTQKGFDGEVHDMYLQADGKVVVVGQFSKFDNLTAQKMVRLNTDGSLDTSFGHLNTSYTIHTSRLYSVDRHSDGGYVVGGIFSSINGDLNFTSVAKVNTNGVLNQSWQPAIQSALASTGIGTIRKVYIEGDDVHIGGYFTSVDGNIRQNIATIDYTTATLNDTGNNGFNNAIKVILPISGSSYFYAGDFTVTNSLTGAGEYDIPIGSTVEQTMINTLFNLQTYNYHPRLSYEIVGNKIEVTYIGGPSIGLSYSGIVDVPDYINIWYQLFGSPELTVYEQPQQVMAAYSPIVFRFNSDNNTRDNYKYLVSVYNQKNDEKLASFRITPDLDGSGQLDVSRILSSQLSYDINDGGPISIDAENSYIQYYMSFGEEYFSTWGFDEYKPYNVAGPFVNNVMINQTTPSDGHIFEVGDQIVISNGDDYINGLYTVAAVPSVTSLVLDKLWDSNFSGTILISNATVAFADKRNVAINDIIQLRDLMAFNGALSWKTFNDWDADDYLITAELNASATTKFLTSLPRNNFYMRPNQTVLLNFASHLEPSMNTSPLAIVASPNGDQFLGIVIPINGWDSQVPMVNQLRIQPSTLGLTYGPSTRFIEFKLISSAFTSSEIFRIYLNHTCGADKVETYELRFQDRFGSFGSFTFDGITKLNGSIDRETYKQHLDVHTTLFENNYNTQDRGTAVSNVSFTEEYELSTGWLNDEMLQYFNEVYTSPVVQLKIGGVFYSAVIEDKSYEVVSQRNKNLVRKTVKVKLANQDPINC